MFAAVEVAYFRGTERVEERKESALEAAAGSVFPRARARKDGTVEPEKKVVGGGDKLQRRQMPP